MERRGPEIEGLTRVMIRKILNLPKRAQGLLARMDIQSLIGDQIGAEKLEIVSGGLEGENRSAVSNLPRQPDRVRADIRAGLDYRIPRRNELIE
jgi:hypothetical protein